MATTLTGVGFVWAFLSLAAAILCCSGFYLPFWIQVSKHGSYSSTLSKRYTNDVRNYTKCPSRIFIRLQMVAGLKKSWMHKLNNLSILTITSSWSILMFQTLHKVLNSLRKTEYLEEKFEEHTFFIVIPYSYKTLHTNPKKKMPNLT